MSLKLYLLRHGETAYGKTGGYCGELDPALTSEGVQMAHEFAKAYRGVPWAAVFVSPMKRTIATAKTLCDALSITMQLRDGLKEIRYGKWEDQTVEYVKQHYLDDYLRWLAEPTWNPPTGGETAVEVASRSALSNLM
jgi:broad specificity phosphatase PhoE